MGQAYTLDDRRRMASRWRRRRMCLLVTTEAAPAALRDISATGAFVETRVRPEIGARVELRHPEAGSISASVQSAGEDGIALRFDYGERSVAFALSAIAADMSRPS
ncbi:hypothetical protein RCO27_03430 [Sphingosinicella sp. LHD-64]|uniref:PilZ domain-containing protein n=1 Tax=Sphingosinicella sp. LHD-64 TaxID=3072139 RepID=UPI00280CADC4|nr:PilZ domain-containing protein [Sphingosinicella sp. LHD-64]MDQ8755274.1 hypothetical protein [Sphingosinicella sp. LHD-64]